MSHVGPSKARSLLRTGQWPKALLKRCGPCLSMEQRRFCLQLMRFRKGGRLGVDLRCKDGSQIAPRST